jgi:hypothetical protein
MNRRASGRPSPARPARLAVEALGDRCLLTVPISQVPVLNSLPGARATLYLDFNGSTETQFENYGTIVTPAYDQDGNATTFSDGELASIRKIWEYVSEDYAPLNINVTTVEPATLADRVAQKCIVGGDGSWFGTDATGVSYRDVFTDPTAVNICFTFAKLCQNGDPRETGDTISHESGHAFGLEHQSLYNAQGVLTQEYYTGPGDGRAPIMGFTNDVTRAVWWRGNSTSATTIQDDLAVLSRSANGFGYRPDDYGNTTWTAQRLTSGVPVNVTGYITQLSDIDMFRFATTGGNATFTAAVPAQINNLDTRLELRTLDGRGLIVASAPGNSFNATITRNLAAGSYMLVVRSNGVYGDLGQYKLTGNFSTLAGGVPNAPTNLRTTAAGADRVTLTWNDNAFNERGYVVERGTANGGWTKIATTAANAVSYVATGLAAGTNYTFRVTAVATNVISAYSNTAQVLTRPTAPPDLTAVAASSTRINLRWTDVRGEASYRVERSTDGRNYTTVATLTAATTTYSNTGLTAGTTYSYRIAALNASGASAFSKVATARTAVVVV